MQELIQALQMTAEIANNRLMGYASMTGVLQPAATALHGLNSAAQCDPH